MPIGTVNKQWSAIPRYSTFNMHIYINNNISTTKTQLLIAFQVPSVRVVVTSSLRVPVRMRVVDST